MIIESKEKIQHMVKEIIARGLRKTNFPEDTKLYFLLEPGDELANLFKDEDSICGIPILYGCLHGSDVPIALISDKFDVLLSSSLKFEEEIRGEL